MSSSYNRAAHFSSTSEQSSRGGSSSCHGENFRFGIHDSRKPRGTFEISSVRNAHRAEFDASLTSPSTSTPATPETAGSQGNKKPAAAVVARSSLIRINSRDRYRIPSNTLPRRNEPLPRVRSNLSANRRRRIEFTSRSRAISLEKSLSSVYNFLREYIPAPP